MHYVARRTNTIDGVEKEPRITVAVRLSPAGLALVDKRAAEDDRTRSDMVRRMLAYASTHMPRGWKP